MKVRTLKPDLLIGTTIYPKGSILEMDDGKARRWLNAKPSPPIAVVVECAALVALAETADLGPKPKRRAAALES